MRCLFATLIASAALAGCTRDSPPTLPARIVSGSMAERFYGEHWAVICGDCGFAFRCGVEHPPDEMRAICPNCGYRENETDASAKQPGMAVEVVPRDFVKDPPRRWEIVAYREADSDRVAVKRIVGLPGERIAIRGGDVFVGDQRMQKSLAEFREAAQPVNDDAHRLMRSPDLPLRWRGAQSETRWWPLSDGSGYRCRHGEQSMPAVDWLEYHHWSCAATPTPRDADAPIRDNDSYNQGLSRAMNTVGDVAISLNVGQLSDGDEFAVRLYGGDAPLVVAMTPNADAVRLMHGETLLAEAPTSTPLISSRDWNFTVAVVDGRVHVEIGGQLALEFDLDAAGIKLQPGDVALAVGSRNVFAEISQLRVLRDVYYLNPHGRPNDWQMAEASGPNEYFLLGDNPPLSCDSRQDGSIAVGRIVGSVRVRNE